MILHWLAHRLGANKCAIAPDETCPTCGLPAMVVRCLGCESHTVLHTERRPSPDCPTPIIAIGCPPYSEDAVGRRG